MDHWKIEESTLFLAELFETLQLDLETILVIGCSTSEIQGKQIGKYGSLEIAQILWKSLEKEAAERKVHLAFQCCEHLNRALVVEKKLADRLQEQVVSARPAADAGGSMATVAWENMKKPVLLEKIQADAGIDIGQTLIGMHLKRVAVPLRLSKKYFGEALITVARTRPPLIGGERARYV